MAPSILLLYHFFFPDNVASASHMYQFAQELVRRGWQVTVLTTNRYCREPNRAIPGRDEYLEGIRIIRLYRPAWDQASPHQRIMNSVYVMGGWLVKLLRLQRFDVVLVGSDPAFAPLILPWVRCFNKAMVLAHWCFDLYPEVIVADGGVCLSPFLATLMRRLMQRGYRSAHLIADLGSCMRRRLQTYHHGAQEVTLVPWALVEPAQSKPFQPAIRHNLFGKATLGLLYSGTLGRAHDYKPFVQLARQLRRKTSNIHICFACRGNKVQELKNALLPEDTNISLVDFVEESALEDHLNAADIHLLSLRKEWEGIVVPSKFFGSLAMGKPVIYAGPEDSAIAEWVRKYEIGFLLTEQNIEILSEKLISLEKNSFRINSFGKNALDAYHRNFSKSIVVDRWDDILRKLIAGYQKDWDA